jgi:methylglyoxal synthase
MKMNKIKNIAIVAFDSKKTELIEWSYFNRELLIPHQILALGIAGNILEGTLNKKVSISEAGRMGENRELCNLIAADKIDAVIILGEADDVLESKDMNTILETAIQHNIIVAVNRTTADFIIHSSFMGTEYTIHTEDNLPDTRNAESLSDSFSLAKAS